jgi:hypothetical protein
MVNFGAHTAVVHHEQHHCYHDWGEKTMMHALPILAVKLEIIT